MCCFILSHSLNLCKLSILQTFQDLLYIQD